MNLPAPRLWMALALVCASLLALDLHAQDKPDAAPGTAPASKPADKPKPDAAPKPAGGDEGLSGFDDRTPPTLYKEYCSNCHDTGIAGAPRTGDKAAWEKLLAERKLEGLVANTYKGIGIMPKRGTCSLCTEDEIRAVVILMLQKANIPAK